MSSLNDKIQRLIDIEDIKALKYRYARFCDMNYDAKGISECFTEDAVWDGGDMGKAETRQGIREFFEGVPNIVKYALHYTTNSLVDVNGDEATGHWHLWQPMVMHENDRAFWFMALYDESYRRVNGEWLISSLSLTVKSLAPYEGKFG